MKSAHCPRHLIMLGLEDSLLPLLCCARETMCATLIKERNVLKVKYRPMLFPRYNLVIFYD